MVVFEGVYVSVDLCFFVELWRLYLALIVSVEMDIPIFDLINHLLSLCFSSNFSHRIPSYVFFLYKQNVLCFY